MPPPKKKAKIAHKPARPATTDAQLNALRSAVERTLNAEEGFKKAEAAGDEKAQDRHEKEISMQSETLRKVAKAFIDRPPPESKMKPPFLSEEQRRANRQLRHFVKAELDRKRSAGPLAKDPHPLEYAQYAEKMGIAGTDEDLWLPTIREKVTSSNAKPWAEEEEGENDFELPNISKADWDALQKGIWRSK
ncbi:uncharacterized protein LTR77_004272 [Saxophila tyrrhenica]|uniref:Uncharacterized protein n=1 Tax=Saxophila tyrrhenica TaxID=1690608 RepID=A0AAV9PG86_9PEZI|nr:hypothetical protein LTR77_004272 [Saxophila tyrrhenica]